MSAKKLEFELDSCQRAKNAVHLLCEIVVKRVFVAFIDGVLYTSVCPEVLEGVQAVHRH